VTSLRRRHLRVGFYYSLSNWGHADYPNFRMEDRPYPREHWPEAGYPENAHLPVATDSHRRSSPKAWLRYLDFVRNQLSQLLTDYGVVDVLWFDGQWERSPKDWQSHRLVEFIRSFQPGVLINDRLPDTGGYLTPEQGYPSLESITNRTWELCMTVGNCWGYVPTDVPYYKSSLRLLLTLIDVAARGGNLLLNTGLRGDGTLIPQQVERFEDLGNWMNIHAESIHDVEPARDIDVWLPVTRSTNRPNRIYIYLVHRPVDDALVVRGLDIDRIQRVGIIAGDAPVVFTASGWREIRIVVPPPSGQLIDVIAIDLNE